MGGGEGEIINISGHIICWWPMFIVEVTDLLAT